MSIDAPAAVERARVGTQRPELLVAVVMALSTVAVWLPYFSDLSVLYRYFDGPLYGFVAKTLYRIPADHPFRSDFDPAFFASYLPLYPLLIRALTFVTGGAYGPAMLLATLLSSTAAAVLFYRVLRALDLVASPVWTAVLFCFLPPRWLIYHAVGATEPLFYCFLFGALLCDARRKSWGVILCVVGASWTRITGVLLVPAFALVYAERRAWRDLAVLPVAGAGTLALLTFHALRFGDFFAYLRWQGGTGHLVDAVPLAAYRDLAASPSFHATELFFFLYVVLAVGTFVLWKCREVFAVCAVFFVFDLFQYNSDLSRILLPTFPFALLVAFDPVLTRREARFALPLVVILAYVYAWGFLPHNLMPEEGYARLLAILGSP